MRTAATVDAHGIPTKSVDLITRNDGTDDSDPLLPLRESVAEAPKGSTCSYSLGFIASYAVVMLTCLTVSVVIFIGVPRAAAAVFSTVFTVKPPKKMWLLGAPVPARPRPSSTPDNPEALNESMHQLTGSTRAGARLCLPFELGYGRWTGPSELFVIPDNGTSRMLRPGAAWRVYSDCAIEAFAHPHEMAQKLKARNTTVLLVGDSRIRRLYFRMASMLKGEEIDLMVSMDLRKAGEFGTTWAHHEQEKTACLKDLRTSESTSKRINCFGSCSCSTSVDGVDMIYLWQMSGWFGDDIRKAWDHLIFKVAGAHDPTHDVAFIFGGAGLHLLSAGETAGGMAQPGERSSVKQLQDELDAMATYLAALPRNVHAIWQTNTPVQGTGATDARDRWLGAQDGLARVGLWETAAWERTPMLDIRMLYTARADCYDHIHCAGATTDVNIQQLMHIALNWEAVMESGIGANLARQLGMEKRPLARVRNYQGRVKYG